MPISQDGKSAFRPNLACGDLDRMLGFYREVAGFAVEQRGEGWATLVHPDGQRLILSTWDDVTGFVADIVVPDLDSAAASLVAGGGAVRERWSVGLRGTDPDGNHVLLRAPEPTTSR